MKQYCRYCANCVGETDYVNVSWCGAKHKENALKMGIVSNDDDFAIPIK